MDHVPCMFELKKNPLRLFATISREMLEAALLQAEPGLASISFGLILPVDAAQVLVLQLLEAPEVGGELSAVILENYLAAKAAAHQAMKAQPKTTH